MLAKTILPFSPGKAACAGFAVTRSNALAEEGVALCREEGDDYDLARGLAILVLGIVAQADGDPAGAQAAYEECAEVSRRVGDDRALSVSLRNLAVMAFRRGDYGAAEALIRESLGVLRALGESYSVSRSLEALAATIALSGNHERAARLFGLSLPKTSSSTSAPPGSRSGARSKNPASRTAPAAPTAPPSWACFPEKRSP